MRDVFMRLCFCIGIFDRKLEVAAKMGERRVLVRTKEKGHTQKRQRRRIFSCAANKKYT